MALNGQLHNVHFQEEFENGRMSFDYKLREGVVTKSNGLAPHEINWSGCVIVFKCRWL